MKQTKQDLFMHLYAPVHDRFERYCKTRAWGELHFKDIMQDTLVVAYEKLDSLQSPDAFLQFLFGTAAKIMANQRKKKKPEYIGDVYDHNGQHNSQENDAEKKLEIQHLYEQLKKLDETTRECIILFEISGFSLKEIMSILNLGESAVKQRLSRGRKQLLLLMNASENKYTTA